MAGIEFALGVEQVGMDPLMRQRACRECRDELLRGLGQHAAHLDTAFLEPTDQVQCLVGGDPAADDQGDARNAMSGLAGRRLCRARHYWQSGLGDRLRPLGVTLRGIAQDHPHLVLDRAAVTSGAQSQLVTNGVVELSDRQTSHIAPPSMLATLAQYVKALQS